MTLFHKVFLETKSVSQKLTKEVGDHEERDELKLSSAQRTELKTTKRLRFQIKSGV